MVDDSSAVAGFPPYGADHFQGFYIELGDWSLTSTEQGEAHIVQMRKGDNCKGLEVVEWMVNNVRPGQYEVSVFIPKTDLPLPPTDVMSGQYTWYYWTQDVDLSQAQYEGHWATLKIERAHKNADGTAYYLSIRAVVNDGYMSAPQCSDAGTYFVADKMRFTYLGS